MSEDKIERMRQHTEGAQFRSASVNAALGIAAAGVATPFVKPLASAVKDKLTNDEGTSVVIPSGTVTPRKG